MCSRYEAPTPERLQEEFGVEFDAQEKLELWPGYAGPFLRKPRNVDPYDDAVLPFEAEVGVFGLLPFWADKKLARSTYNARSETASVKRSFREAWKKAQHCIIPAVAIYEPDWRTGKAIPTRISRADGRLLGIAGLWEERKTAAGDRELSFAMLTVNADDHALMRNFHRPGHEKRRGAVLPQALYQDWLTAPAEISSEFMTQYPADRLVAYPQL